MSPDGPTQTKLVGVDVGGTFTDLVCVDEATGEVRVAKVPTTVANQAGGVQGALAGAAASAAEVAVIVHGTTTATRKPRVMTAAAIRKTTRPSWQAGSLHVLLASHPRTTPTPTSPAFLMRRGYARRFTCASGLTPTVLEFARRRALSPPGRG